MSIFASKKTVPRGDLETKKQCRKWGSSSKNNAGKGIRGRKRLPVDAHSGFYRLFHGAIREVVCLSSFFMSLDTYVKARIGYVCLYMPLGSS